MGHTVLLSWLTTDLLPTFKNVVRRISVIVRSNKHLRKYRVLAMRDKPAEQLPLPPGPVWQPQVSPWLRIYQPEKITKVLIPSTTRGRCCETHKKVVLESRTTRMIGRVHSDNSAYSNGIHNCLRLVFDFLDLDLHFLCCLGLDCHFFEHLKSRRF